jgi:hypothetical protein
MSFLNHHITAIIGVGIKEKGNNTSLSLNVK